MTRKEFIGGVGAFGSMAVAGCMTGKRAPAPALAGDMAWGVLVHLGSNMWRDWVPGESYPKSLAEEEKLIAEGKIKFTKSHLYQNRDYMSVDWKYWNSHIDCIKKEGLNMVFIDIGEAYAYPSHPELHVKGSLSPERMREELAKIRARGLEPIPKLNFSTGHDQWLREYHYMVSSPKYYQVVADVIRDVCEVFDWPRYFHLGFDEEVFAAVGRRSLSVMRQNELWWKDFNYCVGEVERHGARAVYWSDKICAGREDFYRHMSKNVVQMTWYYGKDFSEDALKWKPEYETSQKWDIQTNLVGAITEIADHGYDVMPCTSNWSHDEAADAMLGFCKGRINPKQVLGYVTAPWLKPVAGDDERFRKGVRLFADAKRKHFG